MLPAWNIKYFIINWNLEFLLALLDYVGRAHEIAICPSARIAITCISEPTARISFKF